MVDPVEVPRLPLVIAVAPNGARRTTRDHEALPQTIPAIARAAAECREAGAAMLHLHVRDAEGGHVLDADLYADAIRAVRREAGQDMIIQITTEAVGRYRPDEQMQVVQAVRPEAVSLALRELLPEETFEPRVAAFLAGLEAAGTLVQYILYSAEEVARLRDLQAHGVVPPGGSALYVLGRYTAGQRSEPADLLPFLSAAGAAALPWAVCAFGPRENACVTTAAALGGHARVGFENNMWLPDGRVARDNAELVALAAQSGALVGRPAADADTARRILRSR